MHDTLGSLYSNQARSSSRAYRSLKLGKFSVLKVAPLVSLYFPDYRAATASIELEGHVVTVHQ
jgi:hypothetical protein